MTPVYLTTHNLSACEGSACKNKEYFLTRESVTNRWTTSRKKPPYAEEVLNAITSDMVNTELLFIGMLVLDQFSGFDIQIPTQLTDQHGIDSLEIVAAVPVEVGAWNIQIFTNFIFADTLRFQDIIDS